MAKVKKIYAYEIIDSRGYPTLEGKLILDNGIEVVSAVPAGTSIGKYEAVELRDNDTNRFDGMGVASAASYVTDLLGPKLIGASPLKQQEVDHWLNIADGTPNKSRLGANSTLVISQLLVKAAAADAHLPLFKYINSLYTTIYKDQIKIEKIPNPLFNIINGGKHGNNNNLDFQEYHLIPSSSLSFTTAYKMGIEVFHELKRVLQYRNANISVGEEGGFTPNFASNLDALEVLVETIGRKNLKPGLDVFLGLDMAASNYYKDEKYVIRDKNHPLAVDEYLKFINEMTENYALLTIEDPLNQDDWTGWKKLSQSFSEEIYLIGDDLLTTNKQRLEKAIKEKVCTTILVKPNQIGTISQTFEVINVARKNNFNYIISHRSGETNDSFIADFAVGVQSDFVKFGAPSRGERVAKYNRLWQIEREELNRL